MVSTDVEVEGSYLPTLGHTTSSTTLVVIKKRPMTASPTSKTKRTDALDTSVVVEDTGEDGGHDDRRLLMWKYQ